MSLPAVGQWLTENQNGKKNASISSSTAEPKSPISKKTLLADFLQRKQSELGTDWEDISTPTTSTSGDTLLGRRPSKSERSINGVNRGEQLTQKEP
jgi:serine/arginine repetitive matrix protein 2